MLTIFAVGVSSCKKEDSATVNASMSVKVSGSVKTTTTAPMAMYFESQKSMQIMRQFGTSEGVSISLKEPKVGDFSVSTDAAVVIYTNGTTTYLGNEGSVKITSLTNDTVKGTFSFTGTASQGPNMVLSEGKFEAKIVKM